MSRLDSYELYLARKKAANVVNYFLQGRLELQEAKDLAREHIKQHPGTMGLFVQAKIFTAAEVLADTELAPLIPALGRPFDNQ